MYNHNTTSTWWMCIFAQYAFSIIPFTSWKRKGKSRRTVFLTNPAKPSMTWSPWTRTRTPSFDERREWLVTCRGSDRVNFANTSFGAWSVAHSACTMWTIYEGRRAVFRGRVKTLECRAQTFFFFRRLWNILDAFLGPNFCMYLSYFLQLQSVPASLDTFLHLKKAGVGGRQSMVAIVLEWY